jgi:predicted metal-dependent hydrolase
MTSTTTSAVAGRPPITPRKPTFGFDDVPRYWFAGLAIPTHMVNGVNLLFPAGERFFVRSVYHFLERIEDPEQSLAIRGFGAQEGRHAKAHEDYFATLRAQGYRIDDFLRRYQALSAWLEARSSPELRLAATAAAEHFTAIMAEGAALETHLSHAHPALRELLYWHAAEELEHKSVAYDVLQTIAPSYPLRLAGLAIATVMLSSMWWTATLMLLGQDGVGVRGLIRQLRQLRGLERPEPVFRRVFLRGIREYLRRDFHPDHHDNYHLAAVLLARAEAARGPGAAA